MILVTGASGFVGRAAESGFKEAVRERDNPFGDFGRR